MSVLNQKTINKDITFKGVGLHSGVTAAMTVKPAEPNSGIIFKRIDLKENNIIIPNIFNVSSAAFCTTISNECSTSVSTIEHLMGALYGMGIDNVLMKVGHLKGNKLTDILISKYKVDYFYSSKIQTNNSHGTGCTLSSAIACGMGQNMSLYSSVERAHAFVNKSIKHAPNIGKGNGPLNHLINNIKN